MFAERADRTFALAVIARPFGFIGSVQQARVFAEVAVEIEENRVALETVDRRKHQIQHDQRQFVTVVLDQSLRVSAVRALQRAVARALEVSHDNVAHDLKTPLASVLGAASTMRDLASGLTDAEKRDLLATVIDESERLNRFIANLLDMTKLEAGAIDLGREDFDVMDVVSSAVRRARSAMPERIIDVKASTQLPSIAGDPALLEQLIFNLLDNGANRAAQLLCDPDSPVSKDNLKAPGLSWMRPN